MNKIKKVERQQLRSQVKRKATNNLTSRPSKIIRTELHKFADKLLGSGDVRSIAQSLYCDRRKVYPILPKSREDVQAALDSMASLSSKDEEFVQVNSIETEIVILSRLCSNFHLPVGEQGATDVEFNAWLTEAL